MIRKVSVLLVVLWLFPEKAYSYGPPISGSQALAIFVVGGGAASYVIGNHPNEVGVAELIFVNGNIVWTQIVKNRPGFTGSYRYRNLGLAVGMNIHGAYLVDLDSEEYSKSEIAKKAFIGYGGVFALTILGSKIDEKIKNKKLANLHIFPSGDGVKISYIKSF